MKFAQTKNGQKTTGPANTALSGATPANTAPDGAISAVAAPANTAPASGRKAALPRTAARRRVARAFCAAASVVFFCAVISHASEPGSSGDPIALKSYVDSKAAATEAKLDELSKRVDSLQRGGGQTSQSASAQATGQDPGAEGGAEGTAEGNSEGDAGAGLESGQLYTSDPPYQFNVYEIKSGERVFMGAGAEMVIRTGKALAIKGELGGVVDLIDGVDMDAGSNVQLNHLLVASRDDGRGVRFSADSFVLIKGSFQIR